MSNKVKKKFKFRRTKCHSCGRIAVWSRNYTWKHKGTDYYVCQACCNSVKDAEGYYTNIFMVTQLVSIPEPRPAHWPDPEFEEDDMDFQEPEEPNVIHMGMANDLNMTPEQLGEPRDEGYVGEQHAQNLAEQEERICAGSSCDGCAADDPYSTPAEVVREAIPMQEASSSYDSGGCDSSGCDD